jgi:hypothetical protein
VAAVATTVGVYEALHRASTSSTPTVAATSAAVPNADRRDAAAAPVRSLPVLPFENVGAAEDSFFGQGVSDELTSRLTSVAGVRVLSTSASREYRNTTKARKQIARELGVDYLLAGNVRWDRADAQRADWAIRHGEPTRGRASAESARTILERRVTADPGEAGPRMLLAVAYAQLGRKADALREGARAVEILPVSRDANDGPDLQVDLAYVETLVGESDAAAKRLHTS